MSASMSSDRRAGTASPARCAATSCSVNIGLPSPRRTSSSTNDGGGGKPNTAAAVHGHRVAIETVERDALDAAHPAELGDSTAQVWVADELAGAVGADEHDPLVDQVPGQVLEQVPGRGITPVEIVEADDDGGLRSQLADEPERQDEHVTGAPCPGCRQLAERLQRVQVGDVAPSLDVSDQIDQGRERDRLPADVHTATEEELRASTSCSLGQQRGLPDTRLTADQHHPRLTFSRPRHGPLEHRKLVVPTDDRMCNATASHRSCSIAAKRWGLPTALWAPRLGAEDRRARSEGSRPMSEHPP